MPTRDHVRHINLYNNDNCGVQSINSYNCSIHGVTTFPVTVSPSENYLFTARPTKRKPIFWRRTSRHLAARAVSHHVSVVSPRSKLHGTRLLVEREVLDVYLAEGFVNGRRFPHDFSRVVQYRFRHYRHLVIAIGAVNYRIVI